MTPEEVNTAQKRVQRTGQSMEEAVIALGFCQEDKVYEALAKLTGLPLCNPVATPPTTEALAKIPQALAQNFSCIPMRLEDGILTVAFAHIPQAAQLDQLRLLLGMPCSPSLAPASAVETQLQNSYGIGAEKVRKIRDQRSAEAPAVTEEIAPLETTGENSEGDSVVSLVDEILDAALSAGATDIHLEPFPGKLKIRFRIDGLLQEVSTPPGIEALADSIVSRIKVLAHLDIAEKRLPHDGRMRIQGKHGIRDLRVSILPTRHGETLCLRVLNAGNLMMEMANLGLSPEHLTRLNTQMHRPNGLLLVTGPTGSGKTTTLYSVLSHLMTDRPDLKIITVEDPVEYDIPGITQIQTHTEIGLTFSTTLRSILRHDPDVILVGEIRDRETAEIAIQAALTGHLVLSTLHTSDAVGAINRLINMGVESDLVASALHCVIAQRLVRKLCPNCAMQDTDIAPEDAKLLAATAKKLGLHTHAVKKAAPGGCMYCRNTGYAGRIGIYEILEVNEELEDLISAKSPNALLREKARKAGWTPYVNDAYQKVLQGITDLSELHRLC